MTAAVWSVARRRVNDGGDLERRTTTGEPTAALHSRLTSAQTHRAEQSAAIRVKLPAPAIASADDSTNSLAFRETGLVT